MKCLLLMCSCQLLICILQVFASGFERSLLLDFSEAMFTMKQFERVGGSFHAVLCLGFLCCWLVGCWLFDWCLVWFGLFFLISIIC